jgi:hydrogenase maturation protein HypF
MKSEVSESDRLERLRIAIRGAVQGVGFRPFVYRCAVEAGLFGWVANDGQGVRIEVEGSRSALHAMLVRIERERPAHAFIQSLESSYLAPAGYERFEIRESEAGGATSALVLPDIAMCDDCRREILDPTNRRHRYPFTNCTHCGPRYSIIEALPYDRRSTTMKGFVMCPSCRAEYGDPADRRFHAQPNACPECGPHVELWHPDGSVASAADDAILAAAAAVRDGAIVAVKGIGGFRLIVDATSETGIARLRERKHREEKPLAMMVRSIEEAETLCFISETERRLLCSAEAPIVLLDRRHGARVASGVAPMLPTLGVMLASTPLDVLLLEEVRRPVVATSGNLADEPICIDEREAIARLGAIADLLLVHDRPIRRPVDDSVARVVLDRELVLRRARGYAPLPIVIDGLDGVLAVGAHQKSAVALAVGGNAFISQHVGDLETEPALAAFTDVVASLEDLYRRSPHTVACDMHPDYASTRAAIAMGLPLVRVQHHHAHVLSCMAENELEPPVLGIAWDGTGYGADGTVWGGEFLLVGAANDDPPFERIAHLRTFRLPGGDAAAREPRRSALGALYEIFGGELEGMRDLAPVAAFPERELRVVLAMLEGGVNAPVTSSAGRLFDAVASLVGVRQRVRHEGQGAIELEAAVARRVTGSYPIEVIGTVDAIVDWEPMIRAIIDDVRRGVHIDQIAGRFHDALVDAMVEVARRAGCERVALSGGCFQSRVLTERAVVRLRDAGFSVAWHQRVPPNDGGIALGQLAACLNEPSNGEPSCVSQYPDASYRSIATTASHEAVA